MGNLEQRIYVVNIRLPQLENVNRRRVSVRDTFGSRVTDDEWKYVLVITKHFIKGFVNC